MKKHLFLSLALTCIGLAALTTSCGNGTPAAQTTVTDTTATSVMEVDSLLAAADGLVDKAIEVQGICTHICAHGGGKIFLMGSDDTQTIRVEAGQAIGRFPQEVVNSFVTIRGTLREQRIDEAYLVRWEEQLKAQTAEEHGTTKAGCESEQKARGEAPAASTEERIAAFRQRIAARKAAEGKDYLSFYYIDGESFTIEE